MLHCFKVVLLDPFERDGNSLACCFRPWRLSLRRNTPDHIHSLLVPFVDKASGLVARHEESRLVYKYVELEGLLATYSLYDCDLLSTRPSACMERTEWAMNIPWAPNIIMVHVCRYPDVK